MVLPPSSEVLCFSKHQARAPHLCESNLAAVYLLVPVFPGCHATRRNLSVPLTVEILVLCEIITGEASDVQLGQSRQLASQGSFERGW